MKIIIDECLPRKLKRELSDHDVQTVQEAGWSGKKNGELLRLLAAAQVEVFVTIDGNLQYQQALQHQSIGFVVLSAKNNKVETLLPLMAEVRAALETIQPGDVVKVAMASDA